MVERLGRREQFAHLRAHGSTVREGRLRVRAVRAPVGASGGPAVAFAISTRNGTAVRRNRIRRRLREAFRECERAGRLPPGWYLVTVLPTPAEPSSEQLRRAVDAAIARLTSTLVGSGGT